MLLRELLTRNYQNKGGAIAFISSQQPYMLDLTVGSALDKVKFKNMSMEETTRIINRWAQSEVPHISLVGLVRKTLDDLDLFLEQKRFMIKIISSIRVIYYGREIYTTARKT